MELWSHNHLAMMQHISKSWDEFPYGLGAPVQVHSRPAPAAQKKHLIQSLDVFVPGQPVCMETRARSFVPWISLLSSLERTSNTAKAL